MRKIGIMLILVTFLVACTSNAFAGEGKEKGYGEPKPDSGDCIPDGPR